MIDPGLWASTPFNNATALQDFFGMVGSYHTVLADQIAQVFGVTVRTTPLGDGGGATWLFALQEELVQMARAVGIEAPPDLSSYNLRDETDFASFMFLHAQYTRQLRTAAGIP